MRKTYTRFAVGRYQVVQALGSDDSGDIYLVTDQRVDEERLIKVLHPPRNPALRTRFAAHASTVAGLDHPNLVRVHELALEGRQLYAVLDRVEGQNLARVGALPPRIAVHVAVGLLDALDLVHAKEVVLRDIRPNNVVIDANGDAKLSLVGLICASGSADLPASDTEPYLAPELSDPLRPPNGLADLFSVAQILRFCLNGEPPVGEVVPGALPEPLSPVLQRATARRPEDRFPSAEALREALVAALEQLPATDELFVLKGPPPPPAPEPPPARERRRPWLAFAVVAAMLSITFSVALSMFQLHGQPPSRARAHVGAQQAATQQELTGQELRGQELASEPATLTPRRAAGPLPAPKGPSGLVQLETRPEASLLVDGYTAGSSPRALSLDEGSHRILLRTEGYPSAQLVVVVRAGETSLSCWDFEVAGPCS